jgi:hypothetical protein
MTEGRPKPVTALAEISRWEVECQRVEVLPEREALSSLVNINNITAVNIAIAVNAATIGSTAAAAAMQHVTSIH